MILLTLQISHFTAALLFAIFASIVFGITQRNTRQEMLKYGALCFGYFLGGLILAGWVMRILHR